jgi:hypothetical protein
MQLESRLTFATLVSFGLVACSSEVDTRDAATGIDALVGLDAGPGLDVAIANSPDAAAVGTDAMIELDAGPGVDAGMLGLCPPRGPFGVQQGDVLPSPALVDCEGQPFDLHALCGKTAAYQFHFAGW